MTSEIKKQLTEWAETYNDRKFFEEDPIAFPRRFAENGAALQDVEIAAVFAAHFAWGRRSMIVRDCGRLFDEMQWRPLDYVMAGDWRDDDASIHRTVKWSEVAAICSRLREFYGEESTVPPGSDGPPTPVPWAARPVRTVLPSLEQLSQAQMRTMIFGQKEDPKAANKKINMMRRWLVRDDGRVDLGVWRHTDKRSLVIPLDVHVYRQAADLGLTARRSKDIVTACEITDAFREIFPDDPCKGDFALFGYGVNNG